jgi:hypothetical protein
LGHAVLLICNAWPDAARWTTAKEDKSMLTR